MKYKKKKYWGFEIEVALKNYGLMKEVMNSKIEIFFFKFPSSFVEFLESKRENDQYLQIPSTEFIYGTLLFLKKNISILYLGNSRYELKISGNHLIKTIFKLSNIHDFILFMKINSTVFNLILILN